MSQIPNRLPLISLCLQNSHLVTGYLWRLSGFLKNWSMLARSPSSHTENPVHPRDSSAGNSLLISMNRQQNISAKSSFYEFHSWLPSSVEKPLFASWNAISFGPRHDSQTWKKIEWVFFVLILNCARTAVQFAAAWFLQRLRFFSGPRNGKCCSWGSWNTVLVFIVNHGIIFLSPYLAVADHWTVLENNSFFKQSLLRGSRQTRRS